MQNKERIYFGHTVDLYNSEIEKILIKKIESRFTNLLVENPNKPCHQEGYKLFREKKGNGMLYYLEEVLPKMHSGIFLAFSDGKFGAGVFKEVLFLKLIEKPIYEINLEGKISGLAIDNSRLLSVEETKVRVYGKISFYNLSKLNQH